MVWGLYRKLSAPDMTPKVRCSIKNRYKQEKLYLIRKKLYNSKIQKLFENNLHQNSDRCYKKFKSNSKIYKYTLKKIRELVVNRENKIGVLANGPRWGECIDQGQLTSGFGHLASTSCSCRHTRKCFLIAGWHVRLCVCKCWYVHVCTLQPPISLDFQCQDHWFVYNPYIFI